MSYSKELNDSIVKQWLDISSTDGPVFIDGAADATEYNKNKQGKKLLFILKEVAGRDNYGNLTYSWWNKEDNFVYLTTDKDIYSHYQDWIINGFKHPTYMNCFKMACKIWNDSDYAQDDIRKNINRLAFMNLNKFAGKPNSSDCEYLKYAESHTELLKKQLLNIDPDIIIVATNNEAYSLFSKVFDYTQMDLIPFKSNDGTTLYIRQSSNKTIFFTPHPSSSQIHKYIKAIEDFCAK